MAIGKKGIFFTLIALAIVFLLIITFGGMHTISTVEEIPAINAKVLRTNEFVKDVEQYYLETILRIAAFRTFKAMGELIDQGIQGFLPEDFEDHFDDCITDGDCDYVDLDGNLGNLGGLGNYTLEKLLEDLGETAESELHIDANFTKQGNVTLYQDNSTGPFHVGLVYTVFYTVECEEAGWERNTTINTTLHIIGLDDPLYANYTSYMMAIMPTKYQHWTEEQDTTAQFLEIVNNMEFVYSPYAPSYLNRLSGNITPSECCGIESFINVDTTPLLGNKPASFADYCYFYSSAADDPAAGCTFEDKGGWVWKVDGITDGEGGNVTSFKLDAETIRWYNLKKATPSCYWNETGWEEIPSGGGGCD